MRTHVHCVCGGVWVLVYVCAFGESHEKYTWNMHDIWQTIHLHIHVKYFQILIASLFIESTFLCCDKNCRIVYAYILYTGIGVHIFFVFNIYINILDFCHGLYEEKVEGRWRYSYKLMELLNEWIIGIKNKVVSKI